MRPIFRPYEEYRFFSLQKRAGRGQRKATAAAARARRLKRKEVNTT